MNSENNNPQCWQMNDKNIRPYKWAYCLLPTKPISAGNH